MAAATSPTTSQATPAVAPMTRREFLYYIWAASMALFTAETTGAILWFSIPRFKAGEFGGIFEIDVSEVPPADSGPKPYDAGRFWIVNVGDGNLNDERLPKDAQGNLIYPQTQGVKAFYKICVHLGCLYKWVPTNNRFECPCHGSKYLPTGVRIEGPARRNLDVFIIQALDANGNPIEGRVTQATGNSQEGSAIDLTGVARLRIDTGRRINGDFNSKPGGGK